MGTGSRTSLFSLAAVIATAGLLTACGKGGSSGDAGAAAPAPAPTTTAVSSAAVAGRQLFLTTCVRCHGNSGKGDGPLAAPLTTKPRNLASDHFKYIQYTEGTPKEQSIVAFLKVGNPETGMAAYESQFSEEQLNQLAAYILMVHKVEEPVAGG